MCLTKMRCFIILLIIVYFTLIVNSRPSQNEGNRRVAEGEIEYDSEPDEKDSRLKSDIQDSLNEEQGQRYVELAKNSYGSRSTNKERNNVDFSDFKHPKNNEERELNSDDGSNTFEGYQFYPNRRQTSKYFSNEAAEQQKTQRVNNRNINKFKANHNSILTDETPNKRTVQEPKRPVNEDGDLLFEKEQTDKVEKNDYSNEPMDSNRHLSKQYYSISRPENRGMADSRGRDNDHIYYSRERRNVDGNQPSPDNLTNVGDQDQKDNEETSDDEDGEVAINRLVKKLSSEELQDLLNSLSEEKRDLLKKIIDESNLTEVDAVHKREITKKAQAIEDNGYNDNSQFDSNKVQGASVSMTDSIVSQSTEAPDTNKQVDSKSETSDRSNTKKSETNIESKSIYTFQGSNLQQKSDDAVSPGGNVDSAEKSDIVSIEPVTTKNENKREVNLKDVAEISKIDQSYSCPHDGDPQILDDEDQDQFDQEGKTFKRDVDQQTELDSKMKSLEDSFPNSDAYDEVPGPLVRVKRKNPDICMKKRSAALLPDSKVAFFPYRSETDDDDTEEGNEFDDEGFYERAQICNKNVEEDSLPVKKFFNTHLNTKDRQAVGEITKDSKLGTDTDSVLSGVDGVDENLMFNSGLRNRRTTEDNNLSNNGEDSNVPSYNSKSSDDENRVLSESNVNNAPNYQENDAFGALPRNYDGDLGRYKRIRRLKQSHVKEPMDT